MPSVLSFKSVGVGSIGINQVFKAALNVPNDRVIIWDVVPFLQTPLVAGVWAKIQITSTWREITQAPHQQQAWMTFKSLSGSTCDYEVLMAQIGA